MAVSPLTPQDLYSDRGTVGKKPTTKALASSTGETVPSVTTSMPTNLNDAIDNTLLYGANHTKTLSNPNSSQVQGGSQSGQFNTTNTGNQTSSTSGTQNSTNQQTVDNTSTNTSTQNNTSNTQNVSQGTNQTQQQSTGTTTIGVNDTLGFGKLLQSQVGSANQADQTRQAYLTDLVNNGGSSLKDQVAEATHAALSGPGMVGAGTNANDRAAGYAAAKIGLENQAQRTAAAQALAGNSAATNLASAGNSYLGTTSTSANDTNSLNLSNLVNNSSTQSLMDTLSKNVGQQNTSGSTNTASTQDSTAATNSNSSGTSNASNKQVAFGNTPTQTSSGGSVICTVLVSRGMLSRYAVEHELRYIKNNWEKFQDAAAGYLWWGVPVAKLALRSKLVSYACLPFAKACTQEIMSKTDPDITSTLWTKFVFNSFYLGNKTLAKVFNRKHRNIEDREINALLDTYHLNLEEQ